MKTTVTLYYSNPDSDGVVLEEGVETPLIPMVGDTVFCELGYAIVVSRTFNCIDDGTGNRFALIHLYADKAKHAEMVSAS